MSYVRQCFCTIISSIPSNFINFHFPKNWKFPIHNPTTHSSCYWIWKNVMTCDNNTYQGASKNDGFEQSVQFWFFIFRRKTWNFRSSNEALTAQIINMWYFCNYNRRHTSHTYQILNLERQQSCLNVSYSQWKFRLFCDNFRSSCFSAHSNPFFLSSLKIELESTEVGNFSFF